MGLPFIAGISLAAFLVTLFLTRVFIKSALRKGITACDSNKKNKQVVANMGGFALLAGITAAVSLGIAYLSLVTLETGLFTLLLASLASITLVALIGVYDDLFKISPRLKIVLPVFAAVPLIAVTAGETSMVLPFFGAINFGLAYIIILIPLGITGAANAVNMSAGYNGLEAGIGAVASAFLLTIALLANAIGAAILLAALFGACLAFLNYNWFPARVFPADIGTYTIGTTLAVAAILGNMESFAVICLLPAFYEFAATLYYSWRKVERRSACHNPRIASDGKLSPRANSENYTLFHRILSLHPMRESRLVLTVLSLYAICGCLALAAYFLKL